MMKGFFNALVVVITITLIVGTITYSCVSEPRNRNNDVNTNVYKLATTTVIPDSLKTKYAEWVKETVRAASQNMTGGDYEDADDTIEQAQASGLKIFGVEKPCLRIKYADYEFIDIVVDELNPEQKIIYQKLLNRIK